MRSYHAEELFDANGTLRPEIARLAPEGERRMSANPVANGGLLLRDLQLPDFRDYAVEVARPGDGKSEATRVLGTWLRDVIRDNPSNFRLLGPDETASNRLDNVFQVTGKAFEGEIIPGDNHLSPDGRVMEVLSEHMCQGWLEGYLLTGRHGLFNCYEAFIHIIDSMFNQHAKWLKVTQDIPAPPDRVAELPALLAGVAAGPQRVLAPGPRLHRPRGEQEGVGPPGLPAAGREHSAVGGRPLPALPQATSTSSWRASTRSTTGCPWTTPSSTAPAGPGSGSGRPTIPPVCRTWRWRAAATSPPWRRSPRSRCCASTCQS